MAGISADYTERVLMTIRADTEEKLNRAGDLVRDTMKTEVPVDSGDLKKSIRVRRLPKEMKIQVLAGNKKAYYVHMVVLGTKNHGPNNFMQRAIDKNKAALAQIFGRSIEVTL